MLFPSLLLREPAASFADNPPFDGSAIIEQGKVPYPMATAAVHLKTSSLSVLQSPKCLPRQRETDTLARFHTKRPQPGQSLIRDDNHRGATLLPCACSSLNERKKADPPTGNQPPIAQYLYDTGNHSSRYPAPVTREDGSATWLVPFTSHLTNPFILSILSAHTNRRLSVKNQQNYYFRSKILSMKKFYHFFGGMSICFEAFLKAMIRLKCDQCLSGCRTSLYCYEAFP